MGRVCGFNHIMWYEALILYLETQSSTNPEKNMKNILLIYDMPVQIEKYVLYQWYIV